jgi:hypothetical protein
MNQILQKRTVKNARHVFMLCLVTALVAVGTGLGLDKVSAAERGRTDAEHEVQVLTRGPVHEAQDSPQPVFACRPTSGDFKFLNQ